MKDVKKIVAIKIKEALKSDEISVEEIEAKIEVPKDKANGDLAYPCFNLAKFLRNSPVNIANSIKEEIELDENISKIEAVNGYLNFYLNSEDIVKETLTKIMKEKDSYGSSKEGEGINIVVEYSSPNIAKEFHLGHFRNTVLGRAIYSLYKELGYNVTSLNHLGDWGRQFGLLIEGYSRFGNEYDMEKEPLASLSSIYTRISKLAKEDEEVMNIARGNFKKLEDGDKKYLEMWEYFREVSLKEYNRIYELLNCKFDSYNGEAFFNDKMQEVIDTLDKKGVLVESQGAKVVELPDNMPPCIILKSNGSTIYATRDLAAILYRARTYDFDKCIYVTATEQILHFKQVFEVAKYLVDEKYQKGLTHVSYGMIRLKTGKMSTREGNVIYVNDLIKEAMKKASSIITNKNPNVENLELVSKQIGIGALVFNYLKNSKSKDMIFDLDESLRFDGETGPYVQYTYVRCNSILKRAGFDNETISVDDIDFSLLKDEKEINLVKGLSKFNEIISKAAASYEPAILTRYIIDIATGFSRFYNDLSVITEDEDLTKTRCALVYATSVVIKKGLDILGIECPDKM